MSAPASRKPYARHRKLCLMPSQAFKRGASTVTIVAHNVCQPVVWLVEPDFIAAVDCQKVIVQPENAGAKQELCIERSG